jgi:hypothetical protein
MPWRTIAGEKDAPAVEFELERVVRGFFRASRIPVKSAC